MKSYEDVIIRPYITERTMNRLWKEDILSW
jgi:ribosomal protein L23